jgi:hypothetical protein
MRKRRFSEEQVIGMLREAEVGWQVQEICRRRAKTGRRSIAGAGSTPGWK